MEGRPMSSSVLTQMFQTHPRQSQIDPAQLAEMIETLNECSATCTACADACLSESHVEQLVQCIRLDLNCADICCTTANILTRQMQNNQQVLRSLLDTCVVLCRLCAQECESHAQMHEHCRICAETCRRCERLCGELMESLQKS
jgi:hypothetical protein